MNSTTALLTALYSRIPRRHSPENVKELYAILDEYEGILQNIESESEHHEQLVPPYFEALEPMRATVKKSTDNKASKKMKDNFFDEVSGALKDSMGNLMEVYNEWDREALLTLKFIS